MGDAANPWILAAERTPAEEHTDGLRAGPSDAASTRLVELPSQVHGLTPPDSSDRFGHFVPAQPGQLWLVSAHGGAGSSTLGAAFELPAVTRAWPIADGRPVHVVLVCRSHLHGYESARRAAREWASTTWAASNMPGVRVHGLIVVADVPGRLPKPLRQLEEHVSGAVPTVWHAPWEEGLRTAPATPELAAGPWKTLAQQVQLLRKQVTEEENS